MILSLMQRMLFKLPNLFGKRYKKQLRNTMNRIDTSHIWDMSGLAILVQVETIMYTILRMTNQSIDVHMP